MFLRRHGLPLRCLAFLALAVWAGAMHHDAWLELLDREHHHDHRAAAGHHHGDHSHRSDPEHDHGDSLPLPDTHTEPVTPSAPKVAVDGPKEVGGIDSWFPLAARVSFSPPIHGGESRHPPPRRVPDREPPTLLRLAHSVESNAPPVLS